MTSTLVNPLSFQLGDAGVILNDDIVGFGHPFVDITKVGGFDSAPYRETKRDHEGQDGGFLDAEFETGRDVTLGGTVYGNGSILESYLDSLKANFAPSTSPIPLYFLTETGLARVIFVKPRGCRYDWDSARRIGMTDIQFLMYAEDPRIYDQSVTQVQIPFGSSTGIGFAFSFGFSLNFGITSTNPTGGYIINAGNRPTPGTLAIQGPISTPIVINDTTGDQLQFNISLGSTDTLTVDLQYRTVRLNGTTNMRSTLVAPNWFTFPSGATFLRLSGLSGTGTLTVTFRNAWR